MRTVPGPAPHGHRTPWLDRTLGAWLHRRIVSRSAAHARLLEQYRTGERFNQRFPGVLRSDLLPDGPIRRGFLALQADERRHADLYTTRIVALGQEPGDVPPDRDYMSRVARALAQEGLGPTHARLLEGRTLDPAETRQLLTFYCMAQERGMEELALHREACASDDVATRDLLDRISADECRHHAFTIGVLSELAGARSPADLEQFMAVPRRIEARAYDAVTAKFLSALLDPGMLDLGPVARLLLRAMASTCAHRSRPAAPRDPGRASAPDDGWPIPPRPIAASPPER